MEDFPTQISRFTYKYQRPLFHQDVDTDLLTGFHELSFAINAGDRISIVGSLPLAYRSFSDDSQTAAGNLYLGARWGEKNPATIRPLAWESIYQRLSRANLPHR